MREILLRNNQKNPFYVYNIYVYGYVCVHFEQNDNLLMIEEYFLDDRIGTKFACVEFIFSLRYYSIPITL